MREKRADYEKALSYAFLLLKFRLRSENELMRRLKAKGFSSQTRGKIISFLKEKRFIDDQAFARSWISSRLKKPLGLRRLKNELKLKGVDEKIILSQEKEAISGYSEEEVVEKLAIEKFRKLKGIEKNKARQRVYRYLIYRGFSPEVVIEALGKLL